MDEISLTFHWPSRTAPSVSRWPFDVGKRLAFVRLCRIQWLSSRWPTSLDLRQRPAPNDVRHYPPRVADNGRKKWQPRDDWTSRYDVNDCIIKYSHEAPSRRLNHTSVAPLFLPIARPPSPLYFGRRTGRCYLDAKHFPVNLLCFHWAITPAADSALNTRLWGLQSATDQRPDVVKHPARPTGQTTRNWRIRRHCRGSNFCSVVPLRNYRKLATSRACKRLASFPTRTMASDEWMPIRRAPVSFPKRCNGLSCMAECKTPDGRPACRWLTGQLLNWQHNCVA